MSIVYWHWDIFFKNHNFFLISFIPTPSHLPLLPFSIFCCPSLLSLLLTSLFYFFSTFSPFSSPISTPSPAIFFHPPFLSFPFLWLRSTLTLEGLCEMGLNSKKAMINVEKVAEKAAKEFGKLIQFYIFILFCFTLLYFWFILFYLVLPYTVLLFFNSSFAVLFTSTFNINWIFTLLKIAKFYSITL